MKLLMVFPYSCFSFFSLFSDNGFIQEKVKFNQYLLIFSVLLADSLYNSVIFSAFSANSLYSSVILSELFAYSWYISIILVVYLTYSLYISFHAVGEYCCHKSVIDLAAFVFIKSLSFSFFFLYFLLLLFLPLSCLFFIL